ncbi:ROK family transcriptional regulator [Paenibacillus thailandensis]|uniref:ROK family transcriptional regulator n=1 Tax=Paenibacillus thailandensis TaxID=393250 RepID=A0ABW5R1P7_9BACL
MGPAQNRMDVKTINKNRIYRYVYANGMTSKQGIAAGLGMSMPTVLQNVKELIAEGLLAETGTFESTGGRKAKAISIVPGARHAIGVEITRQHIGIVLVDLSGALLRQERLMQPFRAEDHYFRLLAEAIERFIDRCAVPRDSLLGVGISIPGIVSEDGMAIVSSHVIGVMSFATEAFTSRIPYPCFFANDANAACAAEIHGQAEMEASVYLSLSNSVGGAVYTTNSIYKGDNQRGGEFGHMTLVPGGDVCYCGKSGCLDAYCNAQVLSSLANGNLDDFFAKVDAGDRDAMAAWDRYMEHLAVALNNLRMAFDCNVIIGGYVGAYIDKHLPKLAAMVADRNTFERDGSYVKACRYTQEASAVGAALRHVDEFAVNVSLG